MINNTSVHHRVSRRPNKHDRLTCQSSLWYNTVTCLLHPGALKVVPGRRSVQGIFSLSQFLSLISSNVVNFIVTINNIIVSSSRNICVIIIVIKISITILLHNFYYNITLLLHYYYYNMHIIISVIFFIFISISIVHIFITNINIILL